MQSSSFLQSRKSNNDLKISSPFWSQGAARKRKSDVDESRSRKRFLTEEKLIKSLQSLSLDLPFSTSTDTKSFEDPEDDDDDLDNDQPHLQIHHVLEDNLRRDPFQDNFIGRLYGLECKKLSMQIIPYVPFDPTKLQSTMTTNSTEKADDSIEEDEEKREKESPIPTLCSTDSNVDHLFKRPFTPPAYTVEEPCDIPIERPHRMKRSYSQSLRSNSNLTVVELKPDVNEPSSVHSASDYFIVEPCTPILIGSPGSKTSSIPSTAYPSIRITEYFDFSPSSSSNPLGTEKDLPSDLFEPMESDIDL